MNICYAHSRPGYPQKTWERLEIHLREVAALASQFARSFGGAEFAEIAGRWHDLGKYSAEFQDYLRRTSDRDAGSETTGRVDHSTAGAQHAIRTLSNPAGRLIAYCIAGHHAGLPDWIAASESCLERRLQKQIPSIDAAPRDFLEAAAPPLPSFRWATNQSERDFQAALFCRMVFSCLVDADFLATEWFLAPERALERGYPDPLENLDRELDKHLSSKSVNAPRTTVNAMRARVLESCVRASQFEPGLFSLTVPTGGGKTLASLAFALKHARAHGLDRVVYAIPFTSIIEQNADAFREALGPFAELVLEHHSALNPDGESVWSRLASENWDAPLVVTTNVQFFESLFAASPSQCRRLHRITKSVVILDEVQTLPVQVLHSSLNALRELTRNYRCSIVLCSATQPAIQKRDGFDIGLEGVRELVPDTQSVFRGLKRTTIDMVGSRADAELCDALAREHQSLCILNTKRHAVTLFQRLRASENAFHLSASMCPEHRADVLRCIRERLGANAGCTVVSTQVVEAGVDIDFPIVFRAMTGIDSIAQAAGRCNREGLRKTGRVVVFEPEAPIPPGELRQAAETAKELSDRFDDLLSPDAVHAYFELHYWKRQPEWDRHRVLECFKPAGALDFKEAASRYRIIAQDQRPVIVPYGQRGRELIDRILQGEPPNRSLFRAIQRFTVAVFPREFDLLIQSGAVVVQNDIFPVLIREKAYDRSVGLVASDSAVAWSAKEFIV